MIKNLIKVQAELKAPKNQRNNFGKYNYRSCEDILEGVKPLLDKYELQLTITDDIVAVGNRIYVKATATVRDADGNTEIVTAFAREAEVKKSMDDSQITGSASSYARKYALNGLFLIDDTKDADTQDNRSCNCPKCGQPVQGITDKNGGYWSPQQILAQYGMCVNCLKSNNGGK